MGKYQSIYQLVALLSPHSLPSAKPVIRNGGLITGYPELECVRKNPPAELGRSKGKSESRLHGVQGHLSRKLKLGEETVIDLNLISAVSVPGGDSSNKLQCVSVYRKWLSWDLASGKYLPCTMQT